VVVGAILTAGWCLLLYYFLPVGPGQGELLVPLMQRPATPTLAPYEWTLEGLDGRPVSFETFRGKTVFLNLWATWCPPCRKEMPSIVSLARNPNLSNVEFVCVSIDDSLDSVRKYVGDKNWPMTFLHAEGVPDRLMREGDGLPTTFVIGPDGRVRVKEVGSAQWDDSTVVEYLKELGSASLDRNEPSPNAPTPNNQP